MKINPKKWIVALVGAAMLALTGCGGGGGGGTATVVSAAQIDTQPASVSVNEAQVATFSVTASGTGTLSYQWLKNKADIPSATASSYTTPVTTRSDTNTQYAVRVSNSAGTSVLSSSATLTVVVPAPQIATQPASVSVYENQTATFHVTASGTGALGYQWLKNGNDIPGATASSYTTPVTARSDTNTAYTVRVDNQAGLTVLSNPATLTVQPINLTHLVISEVSSCSFSYGINCWFEIFNPTSAIVNLAGYQIKSTSVNVSTGIPTTQTFTLPSFSVPANGYAVISGNAANLTQRSTQMLYLRAGNLVPFWDANGFIELLNNSSATVDFVRFGSSTQAPVTAGQWSGASVAALPSSATDYGKSIVRPYPNTAYDDTNTSADWISVAWSTPAGRNDVPASAIDADGDGIPSSAKVSGGTYAGMDLYSMGARAGQKDIFIEVDRMGSTDPGVIPLQASLQKVVDAFAAKSIHIHFDAGTLFSSTFSVANFNLGQTASLVTYEKCVTFNQATCASNTSTRRSIYDWKDEFFDLSRRNVFHYLLFGNSQLDAGTNGSSGLAEVLGNDLMVTMGDWGFTTTAGSALNQLTNMQASTIMHELGHNLNLLHGGDVNTNYKPNYWSIMNYMYQLNGLDANPASSTAYLRWKREKGISPPALCSLANSPCGLPSQFIMSYSDGSGSALDETNLLESNNIGRGGSASAYADWNQDGTFTAISQSKDLNLDGINTTLTDYNDWGNLVLPFTRYSQSNSGNSLVATQVKPAIDPMSNDRQPAAQEFSPPASFFQELRHVH